MSEGQDPFTADPLGERVAALEAGLNDVRRRLGLPEVPAPGFAAPSGLTPADALRLAVKRAGGQTALARICGCTQGAVWQMLNDLEPQLSPQYALVVSAALDIPLSVLRPDYYPPDLFR